MLISEKWKTWRCTYDLKTCLKRLGRLPPNYITQAEAKMLGYNSKKAIYTMSRPGKCSIRVYT